MDIKNNTNKVVYVIHAADTDGYEKNNLEPYSVADNYELAEMIAKRDEADGMIYSGWNIIKMRLNTSIPAM